MAYKYVAGVEETTKRLLEFPVEFEARAVRKALRAAGNLMKAAIKPLVPVGKRAIHLDASSDLVGTLRVTTAKRGKVLHATVKIGDIRKGVFYAHMVLGGTKPHVIRSKPGGALNLLGVIRKQVQHPGAKANDFMAAGNAAAREAALQAAFDVATDEVKKMEAEARG
jgi:hypothetical protein